MANVSIGAADIAKIRLQEQGSDPSTPASGYGFIYTKTDGTLYHINDAGTVKELGDNFNVGVVAYRNTNQSINNTTVTSVTLPDGEDFDTDTIHDLVTNAERLTAPSAGIYQISGTVTWEVDGTNSRYVELVESGASTVIARQTGSGRASMETSQSFSAIWSLAATEYVFIRVYQDTGAALNVTAAYLGMVKVGEL